MRTRSLAEMMRGYPPMEQDRPKIALIGEAELLRAAHRAILAAETHRLPVGSIVRANPEFPLSTIANMSDNRVMLIQRYLRPAEVNEEGAAQMTDCVVLVHDGRDGLGDIFEMHVDSRRLVTLTEDELK